MQLTLVVVVLSAALECAVVRCAIGTLDVEHHALNEVHLVRREDDLKNELKTAIYIQLSNK